MMMTAAYKYYEASSHGTTKESFFNWQADPLENPGNRKEYEDWLDWVAEQNDPRNYETNK